MPHNQLKLQGGAIVTETPVVNQAGIATCNRIRYMPDPQGLSLPQKLGGWGRFYSGTINFGVIRAIWGWQDTNSNQWIGLGADNTTSSGLQTIQCTVSGSTGLTTATGTIANITPQMITDVTPVNVTATGGSNIFQLRDINIDPSILAPPARLSVYVTNPISVGGVVLNGLYQATTTSVGGNEVQIVGTDVLGNPLYAAYGTIQGIAITGVTFTAGTPNTLTITFSSTLVIPVGENINVFVADNSITGSYIVQSSSAGSVVVVTTLSSYTFSTTGTVNNVGVVPIYFTTSGSALIACTFPDHGTSPGAPWTILNPTLVGGITLQGQYTVLSVINGHNFTFLAQSAATATSFQYQGAISSITSGSGSGTDVTLNYTNQVGIGYTFVSGDPVYLQGINPAGFNGQHQADFGGSATRIVYKDTTTGSWVSGGSFSYVGGFSWNIYSVDNPNGVTTSPLHSSFWTLDSWGNDLIACSGGTPGITYTQGGGFTVPYQPIYYWDATAGQATAYAIDAGPQASTGAFVAMPQRQIVAWGTTFSGIIDPLLIRWCDINNFNTWAAQVINQAASFRLPSGSRIVGARQVFQQGMIWTDIELWSMTYINQPYVYSFNKIGQGCGLIGKYAHGVLGGVVYWMGKSQFFTTSGEGVQPLPCPIWDVAFQDLDLVNVGKITCGTNAMFNEVAWYFPIKGGTGENSNYVKYNTVLGIWDFGVLDRSAWLDVSVLQQPIGYSPTNTFIYQHEISFDADTSPMGESFTTGWFALAEGDVMPYVDQIWPDAKFGYYNQTQNANITLSVSAQAYPGASQYTYGPYTITPATTYVSPRIRNRLINFTIAGTGTGTWWRLGGFRYRFQQDGKF